MNHLTYLPYSETVCCHCHIEIKRGEKCLQLQGGYGHRNYTLCLLCLKEAYNQVHDESELKELELRRMIKELDDRADNREKFVGEP